MAGRGPAPKDPDSRARQNKDPIPQTDVEFVHAKQPALPTKMPDGRAWPRRTRAWWKRWATDARAKRFDAAAWDDLLDTAVVHAQLWSGDWKAAAELRLRVAKYGVTPEDRARMRVRLTDGLEAPAEPAPSPSPSSAGARERYEGLRVVSSGSN